jgi:hypothetical protein
MRVGRISEALQENFAIVVLEYAESKGFYLATRLLFCSVQRVDAMILAEGVMTLRCECSDTLLCCILEA